MSTRQLNDRQYGLLVEIDEVGPIGIAELALNLGATESATRSAVKRLASLGLVAHTGVTHPQERRLAWYLTDEGERVVRAQAL